MLEGDTNAFPKLKAIGGYAMCRICFERVIPDSYQPARAEANRAAASRFRATVQASVQQRNLAPTALGQLHADDPISKGVWLKLCDR